MLLLVSVRRLWIGVVGVGLAACGGSPSGEASRWVEDTSVATPALLSEVGIFEDLPSLAVYDDVESYIPRHELYSTGLRKERQLYLPDGSQIGVADAGWTFPVGTVLVKTFLDGDTPIETRLIFLTRNGWDYGIYQWLPGAADARKLEGNWAEVTVPLAAGDRTHTLPSRLDCRTCHETHEAVAEAPLLGLGELQTADDLVEAGVFSRPPELGSVEGRTPEETAAFSYFVGNCISCHNGGDSINSSFSLYPDVAITNTVDQPVESETGVGLRVVPGDRSESVLYVSVVEAGEPEYPGPFKVMPPLGVDFTDRDAERVLGDWIDGL